MGAGGAISSPGRTKLRLLLRWSTKEKASSNRSDGLPWGELEISMKRTFKTGVGGSHLVGEGGVFYQVSSIISMLLISQLSFSPSGQG